MAPILISRSSSFPRVSEPTFMLTALAVPAAPVLSRPGVGHAVSFAGFDGATFTNSPNSGVVFVPLKPFEERVKARLNTASILNDLRTLTPDQVAQAVEDSVAQEMK